MKTKHNHVVARLRLQSDEASALREAARRARVPQRDFLRVVFMLGLPAAVRKFVPDRNDEPAAAITR